MLSQRWTGFYFIWAVALAVCIVLAPDPPKTDGQNATPQAAHIISPGRPESTYSVRHSTEPVWVNTRSHVYHYPGQRWYGRTVEGKYMQEVDAIAEGDRATRNGQ